MQTVNFGFIGAGQIAWSAAKDVLAHKAGRAKAVFDLNQERRDALAKEFEMAAYDSVEQLLDDKSVDAVYIAVPNKFHAELAIKALDAGKNVLLEKPFAMNYGEAEQVIAAAKRSGKAFLLGMNQRYDAGVQHIRQLVHDGAMGEVYHAKCFWFRRAGIPKLGTWFGNRELAGGGCLYDIGVHVLDMCLFAIDNWEPVSVYGATYTKFGNRGLGEGGWGLSKPEGIPFDVDDFATALIKFKNGATVNVDVSWAAHMPEGNKWDSQLFGTEMGATLRPAKTFTPIEGSHAYAINENPKSSLEKPVSNRFHNLIDHLVNGQELLVKPHEALAVQKILDGIAYSCKTGGEAKLV